MTNFPKFFESRENIEKGFSTGYDAITDDEENELFVAPHEGESELLIGKHGKEAGLTF